MPPLPTNSLLYRLLSLGLPDFRLLVPLLQDGLECRSLDGPMELDRSSRSLLGYLLHGSLLVLSSVDNGPCDLPRVAAHEE